jgi:putative peptidoglycan lipid II flippase
VKRHNSIIRSAGLIGFATICSRLLGFIRDIVIAKFFGTGICAQAFFVAFKIPNLLRELFGEGAANSAFVPVFSEYLIRRKDRELFQLLKIMFVISFFVLSIITILGIIFSDSIVRIIAPGFIKDPMKLSLTIRLTQIMFPYLIFIGLTAYGMGILHTYKHFLTPAFGPCLLNVALILSVILFSERLREPVYSLVMGVLLGGIMQLVIQIPPILRRGILSNPANLNFRHPGVKKIFKLLIPRIFGSVVYQLNVFVDTICASLSHIVGEGAIAATYYANRLIQFPLAVFGIALSTAVLPTLSYSYSSGEFEELKRIISSSLRIMILFLLPCSLFLFILAKPIICIFFERGAFSLYSTSITSQALMFYCFGLVFYGMTKIMVSGFHSLQDTSTPVKIAVICLLINLFLNLILMFPLKVGGLALASSITSSINFISLFYLFTRRIGGWETKGLFFFFLRILAISLFSAILSYMTWNFFSLKLPQILRLVFSLLTYLLSFILGCAIFKIEELGLLWRQKMF